jgi:chromate transport protein ChrA
MSAESKDESKPEDQPIEAGEVGELHDLSFHEARHRAETAKSLATWLVIILGGSVALHYVLTVILAFGEKEEAIKNLNSIFNAWLPAISSLVSAAATYYFTRDKR